jgi:mevalonate kinase
MDEYTHISSEISTIVPSNDSFSVIKPTPDLVNILLHALQAEPTLYQKPLCSILFLLLGILPASIFSDLKNGFSIEIPTPTLPIAAGLGSSAAFSVAVSAALLKSRSLLLSAPSTPSFEDINNWSYSAEMLFHGSPSGLDNTVATYGGAIAYSRRHVSNTVQNSIEHIQQMPRLQILITNTLVPKETSKLVAKVGELKREFPSVVDEIIDSINAISLQVSSIFASSDLVFDQKISKLSTLFRINQSLLDSLGVGHEAITKVCQLSHSYNMTTKLTGAGGGGCVFTLVPANHEAQLETLRKEIESLGYICFETSVGGPGCVFL